MKKGLIIGNSHVAMIIKSWRRDPDRFADMDLSFFAQPGVGPEGVAFDGSVMRAVDAELQRFLTKSNGQLEIDLNEFDFLTIVACGPSFYNIVGALQNHYVWGWPSSDRINKKGYDNSCPQLISADCLQTTLHDRFVGTLALKLAQKLRNHSTRPIYIVTQPLPSVLLATISGKGHDVRKIAKDGNGLQAYRAFKSTLSSVFAPVENLTIIFQPEETIIDNIYTGLDFTTGAVTLYNLDKEQPEQDTLHANHHYGNLILNKLATA